jgi:hypothetical protein
VSDQETLIDLRTDIRKTSFAFGGASDNPAKARAEETREKIHGVLRQYEAANRPLPAHPSRPAVPWLNLRIPSFSNDPINTGKRRQFEQHGPEAFDHSNSKSSHHEVFHSFFWTFRSSGGMVKVARDSRKTGQDGKTT